MTLDQHVAELRAELAHCILTKTERAAIQAELGAARVEQAQRFAEDAQAIAIEEPDRAAP